MSDQPKALFLADVIENDPTSAAHHDAAAAELRRLHALVMDKQGEIYGLNFARETERKTLDLLKAERDAFRAELRDATKAVDDPAVNNLRTLPEPEPVAWMVYTQDGESAYVTDNPTDIGDDQRALPLYTAPPAYRPLTDSKADTLAHEMVKGGKSVQWLIRAIEREQGIGGNK